MLHSGNVGLLIYICVSLFRELCVCGEITRVQCLCLCWTCLSSSLISSHPGSSSSIFLLLCLEYPGTGSSMGVFHLGSTRSLSGRETCTQCNALPPGVWQLTIGKWTMKMTWELVEALIPTWGLCFWSRGSQINRSKENLFLEYEDAGTISSHKERDSKENHSHRHRHRDKIQNSTFEIRASPTADVCVILTFSWRALHLIATALDGPEKVSLFYVKCLKVHFLGSWIWVGDNLLWTMISLKCTQKTDIPIIW